MKMGVSYCLFDGEELLERSIEQIRECGVDYVNVIWQKISYFGQKASEGIEDFLNDLKGKKLIDELILYELKFSGLPVFTNIAVLNAKRDETAKRNLGLELSKKAGCTYFMTMDTDEFYCPDEFNYAKNYIHENEIDYSAVPIVMYHKHPTHKLKNFNPGARVPFLFNVKKWPNVSFKYNSNSLPGFSTDPTRRLNMDPERHKLHMFSKDKINMHHMRTIRRNLNRKYISTTKFRCATKEKIKNTLEDIKKFKATDRDIEIVENYFNINIDLSNNITDEMPEEGKFAIINRIRSIISYLIKSLVK